MVKQIELQIGMLRARKDSVHKNSMLKHNFMLLGAPVTQAIDSPVRSKVFCLVCTSFLQF